MFDFIIVGQGLAGSVLSHTLLSKGKKILVVDKGFHNSSSWVAAGVFNPITGKRLFKTWKAAVLFPFLRHYYSSLEDTLKVKFYKEMPVFKPFNTIEEQNFYISNTISSDAEFANGTIAKDKYKDHVSAEYGGFETKLSGFVDLKKMLPALKEYIKNNCVYLEENLNTKDLIFSDEEVTWKGYKAKKIIFCEGFSTTQNPYFKWLPFVPVKGEIITVRVKDFNLNSILNKKVFMLPLGDDLYKVGATFDWVVNSEVTEKGRVELSEKLKDLINVPFEIIDQEAGVRPAVKDRRPLIGLHPKFPALAVFNGLGTKGVSLAPYLAEEFCSFLENKAVIDPEANIERYYSLYYDSNPA